MIEIFCWMQSVCFLKSHSISSMFQRTLLDPQLSSHFSTSFPTPCTWFVYLSLAVIPVGESIQCSSARGVMLWPTVWTIPSHMERARVTWRASCKVIEGHHFLWEVWRMVHVSAETTDEGLPDPTKNTCIWVEAPFERTGAKPQDSLTVWHVSFAKTYLHW